MRRLLVDTDTAADDPVALVMALHKDPSFAEMVKECVMIGERPTSPTSPRSSRVLARFEVLGNSWC
jgi:inosine-uridine nucleoside N-ribohydrolase